VVNDCLKGGYIPVYSTVARGSMSRPPYNIKRDTAAARLAIAQGAEKLILLTDVRGLLRDPEDESTLIHVVRAYRGARAGEGRHHFWGMIPKVDCCVEAVRCGVAPPIFWTDAFPLHSH
jgi:acetylglutamate kinase